MGNLPDKLKRTALFSWFVSTLLGELRWIRKFRNRLSRYTLVRNYSNWIIQSERRFSDLKSDAELPPTNAEMRVLVVYRLDKFSQEKIKPLIESLQSQKYPNWDLHIISDGKTTSELEKHMYLGERNDGKINLWNAANFESDETDFARRMEQAEYQLCLILDDGILLHNRALLEIMSFFRSHPEADFIYTDQDRMSQYGERHSPWFKPNWSPELLLSINYLNPIAINRDTLDRIENFWSDLFEGNHWHTLLNYALEIKPNILHLSEILFHFRSTTEDWSYDSPALTGHENWVEKHLKTRGLSHPKVERGSHDQIRLTWSTSSPTISVIIPTKDNLRLLRRCISSLMGRTKYEKYDVTIVDTGSKNPETWQYYEEIEFNKSVSIIRYKSEFNYSAVNNFGARASNGKHLLFLNNDIEILDPDWLEELVRWIELPEIGVVGAKLLYPDHSIQHAGVVLGLGGHAGHVFLGADENEIGPYGSTNWYRNFLAVTGACMMVDREIYEQVGGFDEAYQMVFSDIDLCIRIVESGYRIIVSPFARLIHRVGSTRLRYSPSSDLDRSFSSFRPYLESGDPYYNRNLSYSDPFPKLGFSDEMNRVERVRRIVSRG